MVNKKYAKRFYDTCTSQLPLLGNLLAAPLGMHQTLHGTSVLTLLQGNEDTAAKQTRRELLIGLYLSLEMISLLMIQDFG